MKHVFEPTDNQGHEMCCENCGKTISIYSSEEWDQGLEENCEGK